MVTKEEIYSIRVGRHFLQQVSPGQLRMFQNLIHDFFAKEDWIPLAFAATNPAILSPNMIFIAKDTCFDSRTRDFQTEYSIHIGKDALTNISAKDLMNLYFTLRSFLIRSEGLPAELPEDIQNQPTKNERELFIEITDKAFEDYLIQPCDYSPYIFRRVWNTDKTLQPQSQYGLSTENGTIWDMSRQQFSVLQEKISELLNYLQPETKNSGT